MAANTFKKYIIVYHITWLLTVVLSVTQIYFMANPVSLVYAAIISILISLLLLFIITVNKVTHSQLLYQNFILVFLATYIIVLTWLGLNKTIPEYKEITSFRENRSDFVYKIALGENKSLYKLAHLYLEAPQPVNKIEPNVNHKGAIILGHFLENKIKDGEGRSYYEDMYELAEVSFTSTGHDYSKIWYEQAEKYGKNGAIERFNQRLKAFMQ